MKLTRNHGLALGTLFTAVFVGSGCGGGTIEGRFDKEARWEEFLLATYQEPETGIFIVDGDIPIHSEKQLREFWVTHVEGDPLIVNTIGGSDDRWSDTAKLNITYCVSQSSFGSNYNTMVQAMADATGSWEQVSNINFIHSSSNDGNCTASNSSVVFDVRQVSGQPYLARAFFPNQSRSTRNILVDSSSFNSSWPLVGILRHEVGHTLGFRHEHTRPEAGTCFEDNSWRPLTPYDRGSVMHYPQCNGFENNFVITANDGAGAEALYGPSGAPPPPPPPPSTTENFSGSLARNQQANHGPFNVLAGTTFEARMTGTGDADLYVRFGSAPTLSQYNCRPYTATSNETCTVTVPSGTSQVYVMINGYSSSTYNLAVTYVPSGAPPPPPPPPPTTVTENFSGTLAQGAVVRPGPFNVRPGTTFDARMTGTGDADLYVRFGTAPTTTSFTCRPYTSTSNETCTLTVPSNVTQVHVMVRGYSGSSTYQLAVTYSPP